MPLGSPTSRNPLSAACCAETPAHSAAVSPQLDITVAAVVARDGRYLVVEERIGGRDVLNQPAGHLERGETLLQAVIRETLEETAWTLSPRSLLGTYLWQPPRASRPTLRFAFVGEVTRHDPARALDHPVLAAHWMSRAQLQGQAARLRSPLVLRCIDDFLAGRCEPLATVAALDLDTAASASAIVVD
jgi:8-oxo-dGTP pyrophosphatase MutT (NUDIX family)